MRPEAAARKGGSVAAEELAGYENWLREIDLKVDRIAGEVRFLRAIGGIIVALLALVLWRFLSD